MIGLQSCIFVLRAQKQKPPGRVVFVFGFFFCTCPFHVCRLPMVDEQCEANEISECRYDFVRGRFENGLELFQSAFGI